MLLQAVHVPSVVAAASRRYSPRVHVGCALVVPEHAPAQYWPEAQVGRHSRSTLRSMLPVPS